MGVAKTLKDTLKTKIMAVVPTGTVVLVSVDPEQLEWQRYPSCVDLLLRSCRYAPNQVIGGICQSSEYEWDLYVRVGHAGRHEDAFDAVEPLLETLRTGLQGYILDEYDTCRLEIREFAELRGWVAGSPIYRQSWWHMRRHTS